jgi:hypothetical protein
MAGRHHVRVDLEMTGDALVGAQQQVLGVVHAELHRLFVRPALAGVGLQPLLGRPVTTVAMHPIADVELRSPLLLGDVDGVADQATVAGLGLADVEVLGDPRRAHLGLELLVEQGLVRLGVLFLLEPDDVLVELGIVGLRLGIAVAVRGAA